MAKNDKAFMKTIQERIGVDKFVKGVGEIDYQRRTGKDDGDTSMFTPEELDRLILIREEQEAKVNKEIKDKELKEATTKKQAKGGSISKQMDLFSKGGLKQEGGSVDPVSGNDVPVGSTKEEVRDDIPARLSEGEFVMPADVVRFHGLDKMMELRDEAKMGLKKMEAMGQMGNADEATLPDDVPFGMDDLDMDDEPTEMAEGGVVQAANGTFMSPNTGIGGFQQSQFANYTPQFPPYMPTQLPTTSYIAPQQQTTPLASQQTLPKFEDVIPAPEGKYDEIIEYENEEGLKLSIPFVNGKPIFPIPKGYKKVDKGLVKPDPKPETIVPSTTVTKNEGEGGSATTPAERKAEADRLAQVKVKTTRAKELGYKPANPITSVLGMLTPLGMLGVGKTPGTIDMAGNVVGQDKRTYDPLTGNVVSSGNIFSDITNTITGKDISNLTPVTDEKGTTSMVEIGKGARELGVTPMTAGGMKQYTIDEMRGFINDAQKDLNVAKAEVTKSRVGQKSMMQQYYDKQPDLSKVTTPAIDQPPLTLEPAVATRGVTRGATRDPSRGLSPGALGGRDVYGYGSMTQSTDDEAADIAGAGGDRPQATMSPQEAQQKGIEMGFESHTVAPGTATNEAISQAENQGDKAAPAGSQYSANGKFSSPEREPSGGGNNTGPCFIKGTKVTLHNGKKRSIEKLKKGDLVLGVNGITNKVLGLEEILSNKDTILVKPEGYKNYFITNNHPFYYKGKLVSYNAKRNNQYNPWLGNVLDAKKYVKHKEKVANKKQIVYNIYLDGDHTFYANGLPTHNIVTNGFISFALLYSKYISNDDYTHDIEYTQGVSNRLIRLGYSKLAYPIAYQIMEQTTFGKICAFVCKPFVTMTSSIAQKKKSSNIIKAIGYSIVYPMFYLRGLFESIRIKNDRRILSSN